MSEMVIENSVVSAMPSRLLACFILLCFAASASAEEISLPGSTPPVSLSFQGLAQLDWRQYLDDDAHTGNEQLFFRRLRPSMNAKIGDALTLRIQLETTEGRVRLIDGHMDYAFDPLLNVRGGMFKAPVGLEWLTVPGRLWFTERSLASNFALIREAGVMVYGTRGKNEYQLAVMQGHPERTTEYRDDDGQAAVHLRLFGTPLPSYDTFRAGFSASYGEQQGRRRTPVITPGYTSAGQQIAFRYLPPTHAEGDFWRFQPQLLWDLHPLQIMSEIGWSSVEVAQGAVTETLTHHAWEISALYSLTGESFMPGDKRAPKEAFDPLSGHYGGFALTARIAGMDIDDDSFPRYANAARSITSAEAYTLGALWLLNDHVSYTVDYSITDFEGGAATGDRPQENALFMRLQYSF